MRKEISSRCWLLVRRSCAKEHGDWSEIDDESGRCGSGVGSTMWPNAAPALCHELETASCASNLPRRLPHVDFARSADAGEEVADFYARPEQPPHLEHAVAFAQPSQESSFISNLLPAVGHSDSEECGVGFDGKAMKLLSQSSIHPVALHSTSGGTGFGGEWWWLRWAGYPDLCAECARSVSRSVSREWDLIVHAVVVPPIGSSDSVIDGELGSRLSGETLAPDSSRATYLWHAPLLPSKRGRRSPRCRASQRRGVSLCGPKEWMVGRGGTRLSAHSRSAASTRWAGSWTDCERALPARFTLG
eukprot:3677249-Prymnesium_polylepis.1